jgi:hypothetical protein
MLLNIRMQSASVVGVVRGNLATTLPHWHHSLSLFCLFLTTVPFLHYCNCLLSPPTHYPNSSCSTPLLLHCHFSPQSLLLISITHHPPLTVSPLLVSYHNKSPFLITTTPALSYCISIPPIIISIFYHYCHPLLPCHILAKEREEVHPFSCWLPALT